MTDIDPRAVEAATQALMDEHNEALNRHRQLGGRPLKKRELLADLEPDARMDWEDEARAAIEAAAPYLKAQGAREHLEMMVRVAEQIATEHPGDDDRAHMARTLNAFTAALCRGHLEDLAQQ